MVAAGRAGCFGDVVLPPAAEASLRGADCLQGTALSPRLVSRASAPKPLPPFRQGEAMGSIASVGP